MKNLILSLFLALISLKQAKAFVTPEVGSLCPPGFSYDGANCFRGKPSGVTSFIYQGGFYHSGNQCQLGSTYDGANCYFGPIPWNHEGFIYQNGIYVKPLPHFIGKTKTCPSGMTFDGANCLLGYPPGGREAGIKYGKFAFKRNFYQNCSKIQSGAWGLLDPFWCAVREVPSGYTAFTYNNGWYTGTAAGAPEYWQDKDERNDANSTAKNTCEPYVSNLSSWELKWADEFSEQPDNKRCYTSNDQIQCVYKSWWGFEPCRDRPAGFSSRATVTWTPAQWQKYLGLRNLNKCNWQVFDSFNMWDTSNPTNLKNNNFAPGNIIISNGTLKMKTTANASSGYDCGRELSSNPAQQGSELSRNCPYSGANLQTSTGLPWTQGNSASSTDPSKRYVGFQHGYGRFEFKARINNIGHGSWPALWMFIDGPGISGQGTVELDALEFLADLRGTAGFNNNITYGLAHQTVHNWGGNNTGLPHVSIHRSLPISKGDWHTFAVEWTEDAVRFYVDGCLRKTMRDGDPAKKEDGTMGTFYVPKNQKVSILIGNPASAASWLPAWYRVGNPNGGAEPRSDFKTTEFEVDYVRVYGQKSTTPIDNTSI